MEGRAPKKLLNRLLLNRLPPKHLLFKHNLLSRPNKPHLSSILA
jgi:hypothetical protein